MTEPLGTLLERCRHGEQDAVKILIERFHDSARSLAQAILNDEHLAEDAVQEGFMAALYKLGNLRDTKAFPGWFRQVVRTEAHRILRRRREFTSDAFQEVPAGDNGPDACAQNEELRSIVREVLRQLPPASHQTAELFYLEERSYVEIAELLKVPQGTVKRRLHDARQRLRNMLMGYICDERPPEKPEAPPDWNLPL